MAEKESDRPAEDNDAPGERRPRRRRPPAEEVETDPRFPSGKWTGFWLQRHYTGRQWMSLRLTFQSGAVRGSGSDRIGDFAMAGTYDLKTGKCSIEKTYRGAHRVSYEGRNEGDGLWIWGLWTIPSLDRGGFHLWPAGEDDPTGRRLRAEREAPADRARPLVRLEPVGTPETVSPPWVAQGPLN